MLIINADDWGRTKAATDCAASCFQKGRLTSTTAMVFMEDSSRAATLANELQIDVGLHINFSEEFTGRAIPADVREAQRALSRFLKASRFALLFYNPFLRRQFSLVYDAQAEEFVRLYGRVPSHLDGHQHMHLCSNSLVGHLLPRGAKVRRSFSFAGGEKSFVNRGYRALVDRHLAKRHQITDYFFALSQNMEEKRFERILRLASKTSVELMTHPEVRREFDFLTRDEFARAISEIPLGTYRTI